MLKSEWAQASPGRIWATRLCPGQDLKDEIEIWVAKYNVKAASIVSAVGSLSIAAIRFAGSSRQWNEGGDWELVSLQGTLGVEGIHIHMSVADKEGRVFGGHLMSGCTVRTTMELVIMQLDKIKFHRTEDTQTGYKELKIITE